MPEEPEFYLDRGYSDYNPDDISNWDIEDPVGFMLNVVKDINQIIASISIMRENVEDDINKGDIDDKTRKMLNEQMTWLENQLRTIHRIVGTAVWYRNAYVKLHPPESTDDTDK